MRIIFKNNLLVVSIIFLITLIQTSCNSSNSKKENKLDLNKNPQSQSENLSEVNQEEKTLFFELQYGSNENQKYSYKITIRGIDANIQYSSGEFHQITKALLKEGKLIVTEAEGCPPEGDEDCPAIGDSEYFVLDQNGFGVHNSEGGGIIYIPFIQSKSTHSIEDILNPEVEGYFKGQKLKPEEKIIKINWGMENKTNYSRDMSYSGSRYASKLLTVPNGKKWILLYINEDFTFESGHVVGSVPDLFIDNRGNEIGNRRFSNENNINLSRAKDENIKIYSGSTIKAISSRTNGNGPGDNYIEYKGEMWFLEIND